MAKPKLGSGARFAAIKARLAEQKGVYDPEGLAAWIGRKRYGNKKFQQLALKGRLRKSN